MTDVFVDRIVSELLKTYTTDDMTFMGLMDYRYQDLHRELKFTYGIRTYGERSKIRKKLELVLLRKYNINYGIN